MGWNYHLVCLFIYLPGATTMVIQILVSPGTGSQPEQFSWARSWAHPVPGQTKDDIFGAGRSFAKRKGRFMWVTSWTILGCLFFGVHISRTTWWWVVSNIFYVHPETWGNDPIWRAYFLCVLFLLQLFRSIVKISSFFPRYHWNSIK